MWVRNRHRAQSLLGTRSGKKPHGDMEHRKQVEFRKWFDLAAPRGLRRRIYAIPNGGKRNPKVGRKLKAEGLRAGVLDLHLPVARQGFIGLWIEFKHGDNKLTKEQIEWQRFLVEEGHRVEVCYTVDEAIAATKDYLGMK